MDSVSSSASCSAQQLASCLHVPVEKVQSLTALVTRISPVVSNEVPDSSNHMHKRSPGTAHHYTPNEKKVKYFQTLLMTPCYSKFVAEKLHSEYASQLEGLTHPQKSKWLLDTLKVQQSGIFRGFMLFGQKVCQTAWMRVSKSKLETVQAALKKGALTIHHGNKGLAKSIVATSHAYTHFHHFVEMTCDQMPDSSHHHLPILMRWKDIYEFYLTDCKTKGFSVQEMLEFPAWRSMIKKDFAYVKLPKNARMGKCANCELLREKRSKAKTDKDIKDAAYEFLVHTRFHISERRLFAARKSLGMQHPGLVWSLIIDSCHKFFFPSFIIIPHGMQPNSRMPFKPTGIINHSLKDRQMFWYPDCLPHGSNLIISILFLYLKTMFAEFPDHPDVLYLQADNAKENKCWTMLCFLGWLVHLGWFKEVMLSFLPVGHTHEDFDQMFSTLGQILRMKFETPLQLFDDWGKIYVSKDTCPKPSIFSLIYDWKQWMNNCCAHQPGISLPLYYYIAKAVDGQLCVWWKASHTSTSPFENPKGIQLFQKLPEGLPQLVRCLH